MFVEGRIAKSPKGETTTLQEIAFSQVTFGLDTAENAAYSTNGLLFKQSVRWLDHFQILRRNFLNYRSRMLHPKIK
jgi:hypothetical protein